MTKQALYLSAALVTGMSQVANAQQALGQSAELEPVVVTATRGQPRTVTSSSAPIDVISSANLSQLSGAGDLRDVLSQLLPSFHEDESDSSSSWNSVMRVAGLRGLGGADVLVLVNGKRVHNSSLPDLASGNDPDNGANPVDLDLIPIAAIERIEILRDGASAQYGSDAIAGVINIILKSGNHGGDLSASAGQRYKGDGANYSLDGSMGAPLPHNGSVTFGLSVGAEKAAVVNEPATGAFYFPVNGAPNPLDKTVNRNTYLGGLPKTNRYLFSANGQIPFDNVTVYNTGTFGYKEAWVGQSGRRPNSVSDIDAIYPNGFTPFYTLHEEDFQDTLGLKGTVSAWDWNLSTSYGSNHALSGAENSLNASLGSASPTNIYTFSSTFDQLTTNLDLTRGFEVHGEPLQVSAGLEQRYEYYGTHAENPAAYENGGYIYPSGPLAGQPAAIGAQGALTVTPSDQARISRNNVAGYIETDYNLTDAWYVGVAGRFEHYSDSSGNTAVGKFSTRYEISPKLALRATVSDGFRAPSLTQEAYSESSAQARFVSTGYQLIESTLVTPDSAVGEALGSKPLKPEKSTNYSAGIVFTPTHDLVATLDAYQIQVDDRIAETGLLSGSGINAILGAHGLPTNQSVQYFANAIDTRIDGWDLVATQVHNFDAYGVIHLSLGVNYNTIAITHIAGTPSELSALGLTLFDRAAAGAVTVANPKLKVALSENWSLDSWGVNLRETRYGDFGTLNDNLSLDQQFGAKWLTDISVSRSFNRDLTISVGADNVFDVYPDKSTVANTIGLPPYGDSPFGYFGGYYYVRATYKYD